jgi:hypothetical protein
MSAGAEKQGRRSVDQGAAYLSGSASIKDDLQAIYTLNKEIGAAVWTVFTHLESLKVVLTKQVPESYNEVAVKLESLLRTLENLKTEHVTLSKRMEALDSLKITAESNAGMLEDQDILQKDRQIHLERLIKILYTTNGYDENGNKVPEALLKFDRWSKVLGNAFWSFMVTAVLTVIFVNYANSREQASEIKTKAVLELIEKTKKQLETSKAESDEQERRDKIVADHDDAMAATVHRNKDRSERNTKAIKRWGVALQNHEAGDPKK